MPASGSRIARDAIGVMSLLVLGVGFVLPVGCGDAGGEASNVGGATGTMGSTASFPPGVDPESLDPMVRDLAQVKLQATIDTPDSPRAWAELADVWMAHARYDLAVDPAGKAVELAPESARRRLLFAVALEGAGENLAAGDVALAAVDLDPENAQLAWRASRFAFDAGDLEEARRLATRAVALAPNDVRGSQALALVELADGDAAAAIAAIGPVVRANKDDKASRFLLGRALQLAGRDAEAARELMIAGEARPVFVDAWTQEVRDLRVDRKQRIQDVMGLAGAGRLQEALDLADELEALYGADREILFSRVVAHAVGGRRQDVVTAADAVIAVEPDWAPPRLRAGLASLALAMAMSPVDLDGVARARREGERCIQLAPGDPQSHELLGRALAAEDRWEDALVVFRRCLSMAPSVGRYHIAVGDCLVQTGGHLEAINLMRKMNNNFGRSVDAALVESRAMAAAGRPEEARRLRNECRAAIPNHPGIIRTEKAIVEAGG